MQRRGQTTFSTYLFVAALLGALYLAVIYIPPWTDNLSVKEAVAVALNKGYSTPDDIIASVIVNRVNGGEFVVGSHYEENEDGERVEVKGLGLVPENVTIYRNEGSRSLTITVDYFRTVRLIPFKKFHTLHFTVEKEQSYQ